jgi:hypothetical protein
MDQGFRRTFTTTEKTELWDPRPWSPREDLDAKSFAFGIQFGGRPECDQKDRRRCLVRSSGCWAVHGS